MEQEHDTGPEAISTAAGTAREAAAAGRRAVVWADLPQAELVRQVVDAAGLTIVAVGSPTPTEAAELRGRLVRAGTGGPGGGAESELPAAADDFRRALGRDDVDLVLIACAQAMEPEERRLMRDRSIPIFSLEPRPALVPDSVAPGESDAARFIPLARTSPGFRAAGEIMESFGEPRLVHVAFRGPIEAGTLFARLFDAWDWLETIAGPAEEVDATLVAQPPAPPGVTPPASVPESLRTMHGHLAAHVRFPRQRGATLSVSNRQERFFRGSTILGEAGCLRIDDAGFEWIDPAGRTVENHREATPVTLPTLLARAIAAGAADPPISESPVDTARLIALCEATRLSCLTGEGEAPRKMMEMLGRL